MQRQGLGLLLPGSCKGEQAFHQVGNPIRLGHNRLELCDGQVLGQEILTQQLGVAGNDIERVPISCANPAASCPTRARRSARCIPSTLARGDILPTRNRPKGVAARRTTG